MARAYVVDVSPYVCGRTWSAIVLPYGDTCPSRPYEHVGEENVALLRHDPVPFMADGDAMSFLMRILRVEARMSFCSGLGEKMVKMMIRTKAVGALFGLLNY